MVKNGRLYIDATGLLEKYIGASIDYEVAGLPRAYLEDVNVSSFIAATYSKIFESGLQNLNMLSILSNSLLRMSKYNLIIKIIWNL